MGLHIKQICKLPLFQEFADNYFFYKKLIMPIRLSLIKPKNRLF